MNDAVTLMVEIVHNNMIIPASFFNRKEIHVSEAPLGV